MSIRLCAIVLGVIVEGACASAPHTRSFQDLPKYLDQGSTIRLTETTGSTSSGRLTTLSPTMLSFLTSGTVRDVPESRVARIEEPERWIGRGALIGLAVGLGVGIIASRSGSASGNPLLDTQAGGGNVAIGVAVGTAMGALVGVLVKIDRTIYIAPTQPAAPSLDPHEAKGLGRSPEL